MKNSIRIKENKHTEKSLVEKHYHQVHQILYVLENKGEIKLNDQTHPFTQDSLAFITPYSPHAITSDTKMTVLVLEFSVDQLGADMNKLLLEYCFDETKLVELNLFEAGSVRQLLRRMLYEQSQGGAINQMAMKIYCTELLLALLRSRGESNITNANTLRAERLRRYIDTHYFEVSNATEISQKIGISTRHVNTIFKEHYDTTPMKYLNEVRLEIAKKLLAETENDIASICFEIGFESLSTFYRRFKEFTDVSPNQFRLSNQYSE
ncbi:helix-turn-helix domain-containing protein [Oceanobacillus arenosus]|uniref:helix-turn-helix domain-containing protein n=1 Tax=Oceanobacillus arenosus TaxID=1229153 RepID=UPI001FEA277F|nr:AraC family transcriptional regulator [Oceanobacillus arenosus]